MDDQGPPRHPILTGILTQLRRLTFLERLWLIEAILSELHSRFFVSQSGFAYDPSQDTDDSEIDVGGPMIPPPNFVAYPSVHMRRWCEHDDSFANSHMEKKVREKSECIPLMTPLCIFSCVSLAYLMIFKYTYFFDVFEIGGSFVTSMFVECVCAFFVSSAPWYCLAGSL